MQKGLVCTDFSVNLLYDVVIPSAHSLMSCFKAPPYLRFQRPLDQQRRVLFTLDKPLAAVCLLIQLERTATEEDGVKASVYTKKDAVSYKRAVLVTCKRDCLSKVLRTVCAGANLSDLDPIC